MSGISNSISILAFSEDKPDELEEIIDGKNERIQELENGQEGYVMVEEDLLHNIDRNQTNFRHICFMVISMLAFAIEDAITPE